jgi:hypothetical protein
LGIRRATTGLGIFCETEELQCCCTLPRGSGVKMTLCGDQNPIPIVEK